MKEFHPDTWLTEEDGLANRLRAARVSAGLAAKQLAAVTGMQPAKISRLETGRRVPTEQDIRAWAQATGLGDDATGELMDLLRDYRSRRGDYETALRYGQTGAQLEYNRLFKATRHFRVFATTQVPGFLQVPDYARQILTEMRGLHDAPDDVESAVEIRRRRGEHLGAAGKRFEIILAEPVLRWLLCDPGTMRAQIGRLHGLIGMRGVRFGIIPMGVRLSTTPQHGFGVYDDALVIVETFALDETYTGGVPEKYVRVMDLLWAQAAEGPAAAEILTAAMAALPA